jgi:hypothetical protein
VNEGIVETGVDVTDTENNFSFLDFWAKLNDFLFGSFSGTLGILYDLILNHHQM